MITKEKIIIERLEHGFNVIQGDRYSDQLGFDEMLGLVAILTMPEHTPHRQWMKTKEEHDAWRKLHHRSSEEVDFTPSGVELELDGKKYEYDMNDIRSLISSNPDVVFTRSGHKVEVNSLDSGCGRNLIHGRVLKDGKRIPHYWHSDGRFNRGETSPVDIILKPNGCNSMRRVIIESPYAGDIQRNIKYARACLRDSLLRKESPIASHLLYTQDGVLDDGIHDERTLGINAGLEWLVAAELHVFYCDYGITPGMQIAMERSENMGKEIKKRYLYATRRE